MEPNGNLNYTISLTGTSLVTGMEVLSRTAEEVLGLEVVFMDDLGVYTQYTVVVVPRTGGGEGPGENASFTSPEQGECNKIPNAYSRSEMRMHRRLCLSKCKNMVTRP